jgi:HEPN domain-containing protein/predicted nucleotidyltransferase
MNRELPERSKHMEERLAEITAVIRELLGDDLAMLVLFGSYARGDWVNDRYTEDRTTYTYESDFDILAVTEDRAHATMRGEALLRDAVGRRLKRAGLDRPSVTLIVEDIKHLDKDLRRGSYFFVDVKKEGVLLYDNGRHTLPEPGPIDPADALQYAKDDYEHWYTSACGFYKAYEGMFELPHYNNAAFLLHQATERFWTAVILAFGQYRPKTHDIEKLGQQASNLHADLFTAFPRATEEQKRRFELLKKAYIDARYKRDYVITQEELEYLAGRVRKMQEIVKRVCEERIAHLASRCGEGQ